MRCRELLYLRAERPTSAQTFDRVNRQRSAPTGRQCEVRVLLGTGCGQQPTHALVVEVHVRPHCLQRDMDRARQLSVQAVDRTRALVEPIADILNLRQFGAPQWLGEFSLKFGRQRGNSSEIDHGGSSVALRLVHHRFLALVGEDYVLSDQCMLESDPRIRSSHVVQVFVYEGKSRPDLINRVIRKRIADLKLGYLLGCDSKLPMFIPVLDAGASCRKPAGRKCVSVLFH